MDIFATKIGKQDNNADFLYFDESDKKQEDKTEEKRGNMRWHHRPFVCCVGLYAKND